MRTSLILKSRDPKTQIQTEKKRIKKSFYPLYIVIQKIESKKFLEQKIQSCHMKPPKNLSKKFCSWVCS